ncbi:MAG TPA: adaptor protein MecA, partial [Defluviitaleaceae bacterium]|nr:adaptor protein MecA [Defluviitaleaceae bacterium]
MKIEKISDTQIKIILNQADLKNRDIKISELAYGSKKAQELFRDMMETA